MKTAKLTAEKPVVNKTEKENSVSGKKEHRENKQPAAAEAAETGEKRKLPWELVFLFVVMGITMVVIALKAFSIM
ncbi:MAG: hypothetical protein ACM3U0_02120 [archaeon]